MKRIVFAFLAVILLASFCACGKNESLLQKNDVDTVHSEPPAILHFNSIEEYFAFTAIAEYDDDEFEHFIMENSDYALNGIHSSEDAGNVRRFMEDIPFPRFQTFTLSEFSIEMETGSVTIHYVTENAERMRIVIQSQDDAEKRLAMLEEEKLLNEEKTENERIEVLYHTTPADADEGRYSLTAKVGGIYLMLTAQNTTFDFTKREIDGASFPSIQEWE